MAKKAETTGITIPKLETGLMEVVIVGDAPLLVHKWSKKAKEEMLAKQMKKARSAKTAKDPVQDFKDSIYYLPDGTCGFPSVAFKAAAVMAVTSVSGVTKVEARQAFHILGEDVDVPGAFEGSISRDNLVKLEGGQPRMREDMVRIGMGTADLRYRAEFWPWRARILVRYSKDVLSEEQILNIINRAGFGVGVGEWRPERDGDKGLFHVATEADMKVIDRETSKSKLRRAA